MTDSTCSGKFSKLTSWDIAGGNGNCCSWDGVECDGVTGYVVGLDLSNNCLYGSIDSNSSLFELVHLQKLNLAYNHFNRSKIPESIGQLSELRYLNLSTSEFLGQIPYAISKLYKLSTLDLSWNGIPQQPPLLKLKDPDLSTLILNLTNLQALVLNQVRISSSVPDFLANFSSLKYLHMASCDLQGKFPEKIFQLPNFRRLVVANNPNLYGHLPEFDSSNSLKELWLIGTGFYGKLPSSIGNLFSLTVLHAPDCNFSGSIPFSLGNLTALRSLDLAANMFSGQIPSSLGNLTKLDYLQLSYNHFNDASSLAWLPKQSELSFLILSEMSLHGDVLSSLGNLRNLKWLIVSYNQLVGQIPSSIRNMGSLMVLDIKDNELSGRIPPWLGNFSNSLELLSLANNSFEGSIPDTFGKQQYLKYIELSDNYLQGQIPRSLSNCNTLEIIALRKNQLNDVFPSWLGTLQNLRILILKSNQFHGAIGEPINNSDFPMLHIIDLSCNNFSNNLPVNYIKIWNAMKTVPSPRASMNMLQSRAGRVLPYHCFYTITIVHKGSEMRLPRVLDFRTLVDVSCNRFEGEIPSSVGNLRGLQSLNLSHNMLTGPILSSLENMTRLESLDLSYNNLSGSIPPQLSKLTFLAIFNVSYNNLSGPIPSASQLVTRDSSSYEGNPRLCGMPLPTICGASQVTSSTSEQEQNDRISFSRYGWKTVLIGYGCGIVFGVGVGNYVFTLKQEWFMKIIRIAPKKRH